MPGGTNRVLALRADRVTVPAAERIVGNETASKLLQSSFTPRQDEPARHPGRTRAAAGVKLSVTRERRRERNRKLRSPRSPRAARTASGLGSSLNFFKPVPRAEAGLRRGARQSSAR